MTRIPRFRVYLFDVDGTLVDSASDICAAQQHALATAGLPAASPEVLKRYIGRQLADLFGALGADETRTRELIEHYRDAYLARHHAGTSVYPGVAAMLAALEGRKATATTKSTRNTRVVLEMFGLIGHFEHVQGTDGFPAKPEPDVILRSLEALGARPEDCLLVGDSAADMEAGRRAGVALCAARWGYGDAEEMARWQPDYWVDRPDDLAGP